MATRIVTVICGLLLAFGLLSFANGTSTPASNEAQIHKVQEGETLWTIAEKYYGDGKLWPKIWDANKDKVSNAQSLKVGDELVIPPKEGELPAATPAPESVAPTPSPVAETTLPPASTETAPAPEQPQATAQPPQPSTPVAQTPTAMGLTKSKPPRAFADDADLYCSFFVADGQDESIRLIASEHQDSKIGFDVGDSVFINKGTVDGIAMGMEYMVVNNEGHLKHPVTHQDLGTLYHMLGRVRVECIYEKTCMGTIVQGCTAVELGNILIPFKESPVPTGTFKPTPQCQQPTGRSTGYVVHSQDNVMAMSEGHDVLIDLGSRDGIVPGDILTIYREDLSRGRLVSSSTFAGSLYSVSRKDLPRWVLGNLVVVMTQEKVSTARIIESYEDISVGDRVEIQ